VRVKPRVILAGAGHANIAALRILSKNLPDAEFVLINDGRKAWYTGALPSLIRGDILPEHAFVDASLLAQSCGARFIDARLLDFENNWVRVSQGEPLRFDFLAISIGALPNDGVKPIGAFLERLGKWTQMSKPDIGIVGGGAAAVELALALRIRLGPKARMTMLAQGAVLAGAPKRVRKTVLQHLHDAKIQIVPKFPVLMDEVLYAYTPEPKLRVRETLQLEGRDNVFAAGDCALFPQPLPRSGAIAVRQGHTLAGNLRRALAGQALHRFKPPSHTLAILSLTSETATAWRGPFCWTGRLAMKLKTKYDTAWLTADDQTKPP